MGKWIKFSKHVWGLAGSILIFNKINFYCGLTDHWGIGANVNFYDRSLTFELFNVYLGVEILHSDREA